MQSLILENLQKSPKIIAKYREKFINLFHDLSEEINAEDDISAQDTFIIYHNVTAFSQAELYQFLDRTSSLKMSKIIKINLLMMLKILDDEVFLKKMCKEFNIDDIYAEKIDDRSK